MAFGFFLVQLFFSNPANVRLVVRFSAARGSTRGRPVSAGGSSSSIMVVIVFHKLSLTSQIVGNDLTMRFFLPFMSFRFQTPGVGIGKKCLLR
jgi:hypothetical protein